MASVNTAVNTKLEGRFITIEIDGLETVSGALGDLRRKSPAALKVAVNQTARQTRKWMIAAAKARYVVNAAGQRHLNDLKTNKKATNADPSATLFISKMRNDLGYFENKPRAVYTGRAAAARKGTVYQARVLREHGLSDLTGTANPYDPKDGDYSKGFLAKFKSGHIGMVQRIIGSDSGRTTTESGRPRWRNRQGKVEKLVTMGSPSATAMHTQVWPMVEDDVEAYLVARLRERVDWILARAGKV